MTNLLQINQRFVIDEDNLLGKGSTGNVYVGFYKDNHNKKYAVKAIDLSKITNPVTQYLLSCQIVALTDLSKIPCKHIVKLQTQPIFHKQFIYLVMELLQGGSLSDVIQQNRQGMQQLQTIILLKQILQPYHIIKKQGIVHRDIKPDNFLFRNTIENYQQGFEKNQLCFIDFGYCLKESVPNKPEGYYNVGSPKYMSPQAYKESQYSQKSDIWAMGVILYEMLHGTTIDSGMNMEQYFSKLEREGLVNRKGVSQQIWSLLIGMLKIEADKRFNLQIIEKTVDNILSQGITHKEKRSDILQHMQPIQNIQNIQPSINNQASIYFQNNFPQHRQAIPQLTLNNFQQNNVLNQSVNMNTKRSTTSQVNQSFIQQNQHYKQNLIKSPLHISERFVIDEEQLLGKGSTGDVYLGFEASNYNKKYAVKAIDLSKVTNPVTQYLLSCQIVALKDLSQINCKYIVKLQDISFHEKYCYLVMQLLEGGSLAEYIRDNSKGLSQSQAIHLFKQMFEAYGVIKSLEIIHRDIKPDNLIFRKLHNNQNQTHNELCFIDFGYCLKQSVPNKPEGYYNVGSPKYMSPQAYKESQYSQKSDIWAMGVILYEMLHGTTIDSGMNMEKYFSKLEREGLVNRKGVSQQIWSLLVGMLTFQVQRRSRYQDLRIKLQNMKVYVPLSNINNVPLNSLKKSQNNIIGVQGTLDRSYASQFLSKNSELNNSANMGHPQNMQMIPQLQFQNNQQNNQNLLYQNVDSNSRRSLKSQTQPATFSDQKHQLNNLSKSHLFPQQKNTQMRRYSSSQKINQSVIFTHAPMKVNLSQKIIQNSPYQRNYPNQIPRITQLQQIEQQQQQTTINMKRQLPFRERSNQNGRKINPNIESNRYEAIISSGIIPPNYRRPAQQYEIKNPQMFPTNINRPPSKFINERQSIGMRQAGGFSSNNYKPIRNIPPNTTIISQNMPVNEVRSENIIREASLNSNNESNQMRRQMSANKLNQQINQQNTNQKIPINNNVNNLKTIEIPLKMGYIKTLHNKTAQNYFNPTLNSYEKNSIDDGHIRNYNTSSNCSNFKVIIPTSIVRFQQNQYIGGNYKKLNENVTVVQSRFVDTVNKINNNTYHSALQINPVQQSGQKMRSNEYFNHYHQQQYQQYSPSPNKSQQQQNYSNNISDDRRQNIIQKRNDNYQLHSNNINGFSLNQSISSLSNNPILNQHINQQQQQQQQKMNNLNSSISYNGSYQHNAQNNPQSKYQYHHNYQLLVQPQQNNQLQQQPNYPPHHQSPPKNYHQIPPQSNQHIQHIQHIQQSPYKPQYRQQYRETPFQQIKMLQPNVYYHNNSPIQRRRKIFILPAGTIVQTNQPSFVTNHQQPSTIVQKSVIIPAQQSLLTIQQQPMTVQQQSSLPVSNTFNAYQSPAPVYQSPVKPNSSNIPKAINEQKTISPVLPSHNISYVPTMQNNSQPYNNNNPQLRKQVYYSKPTSINYSPIKATTPNHPYINRNEQSSHIPTNDKPNQQHQNQYPNNIRYN